MILRLLESAKEDLHLGYWFYEEQEAGLGTYFLDCMHADVRSLLIFAGIHEMIDGDFRLLAKRFPFAIYYCIEGEIVDVYAILDCRRDPKWIAERLSRNRLNRPRS